MKQDELRQTFLRFFENKKHQIVAASPLVLPEDPSLLFVNAGMNQFKDVFLNTGKRAYSRAVNSQVCVRVSGKHNDLEDVGKDTTHLTSFEMLGNWSFGDYSKKEAILWAWEFLTEVLKLPKAHLYASVHHDDEESLIIWKEFTDINKKNIVSCSDKDNFWEMGETGPCGPCSEIHFDRKQAPLADANDPVDGVNGSSGRVVELWNLVFIQSERKADGRLVSLAQKHVDTGAGFERLLAVMQNKESVYETDVLAPIIEKISQESMHVYYDDERGMPHRVIADHLRTLSMAIADNVMPSNEGRGYVLRRLLRRASRYARKLGQEKPFIYTLVDQVVASIGQHFQQLIQRQDFIQSVIRAEESQFLKTLDKGLQRFESMVAVCKSQKQTILSGTEAFKLYDTYGFPLDLTQILAEEQDLKIDEEAFKLALNQQKMRSRAAQSQTLQEPELPKPKGGEARFVTTDAEILKMSQHHSATHLLQAALQLTLGQHVNQAGSLVDVDHLRFDFTHPKALSHQELLAVQTQVETWINEQIPVKIYEKPYQEAKSMGAMALFGEKYGDVVRVVDMGSASMELCVGHHVKNTAEIEAVKIVSEHGVAAGIRRIDMIAGREAIARYDEQQRLNKFQQVQKKYQELLKLRPKTTLTCNADASLKELEQLEIAILNERKEHNKDENQHHQKAASARMATLQKNTKHNQEQNLFVTQALIDDVNLAELKIVADELAQKQPKSIVLLAGAKGMLFVKCSKAAVKDGYDAGFILKKISRITGGKGGGRAESAQGGGAALEKCEWALRSLQDLLIKTRPEQLQA